MSFIRSKSAIKGDYFLTENGRTTAFALYGGLLSAVISGHIVPNTYMVYRYRDFVRLYSKGFSVPVPEELDKKFKKTLDLLKIDKRQHFNYETFMTCGFDITSMGSGLGRFGIHIGLPINFTFNNVDEIDKSKILVNQDSVVWDSDAGKQLLSSLVIPEKAQLYAIAREIKLRESFKLYIDTFLATFGMGLTYVCSANMNDKLKLLEKPRSVRLIGYALITAFNGLCYFMCKDLNQNIYEERIDKELVESNSLFKEGGQQFYSQILERNKALRVLMGRDGESAYTVMGNENYLIRNKHRPLVQRLAFFEEQVKTDGDSQPI